MKRRFGLRKEGIHLAWAVLLILHGTAVRAFDGPFGPWADQDIGQTGAAGIAGYTNGTFTISGAGADVWGAADAFHYAYRSWSGDCGFIVRVTHVDDIDAFSRVGIMFRQTLAPDSPHTFVLFRAAEVTAFQCRDTASRNTWLDGTWWGTPYWLKLVRLGNTFFGYDSSDGTNWHLIGSTNINMPGTILVGLAATSHSYGALSTATCDNVQIASRPAAPTNLRALRAFDSIHLSWQDNSTNEQGFRIEQRQQWWGVDYYYNNPVGANITNYIDWYKSGVFWRVAATNILDSAYSDTAIPISGILDPVPPPWRGIDIGPVGLPGGENFRDDVFSIASSGTDIGGVADQFRFVYQTLSGDGEIVGIQPGSADDDFTNYGGKGGIMFRQSLKPGSANAFFFCNAGASGFGTQMRPSLGANTQTNVIPRSLYPYMYWIRLTRNTNTFTVHAAGYDYPSQWITLSSWKIPMTDPIYIGMAATSHDNSFLQTARFPSLRFTPKRGTLAVTRQNNSAIQVTLTGMFNHTYGIEASTNLIKWTRLTTQVNSNGTITVTETNAAKFPRRYYRSVLVR